MVSSTTAATAGMSTSRQKNCNSCVQTKRRCDRRTPVCSRCVEKRIPCVYSKSNVAGRPDRHGREQIPCTEAPSLGGATYSPFAPGLSFDMDYVGNMLTDFRPDVAVESTPQPVPDTAASVDTSMETFFDFIGIAASPVPDRWLVPTEGGHLPGRPPTPADEEVMRGYQKMSTCAQIDVWHLYDPETPLYYITNRVKGFTEEMATKNTTPFLHRHLYHGYTPQCIISCFTTCVLYASRTPANTAMVMRALQGSARGLVDAETHRAMSTPIEKLARAQALFLYQIIRLFDGDIALRAQGERDMPLFKTWLGELCNIRDNLGDLARLEDALVQEQPPVEWEQWIFAESLRRTVHMAYSVVGLYELMKEPGNTEAVNAWAYIHRWTLSRSLWEASSSSEFQRAWRENPHFVIANYSFDKFLESGKGEDVDDFAEILLTVYLGIGAMKEFLSGGNPDTRRCNETVLGQ
ncbi:hypothetical protein HD806DRAFT_503591 [Xylariaceae sp. AK1471]|nr:hypothetical protein HD806DRAFT_503591 [Xylariaceae sp. AK1471]